MNAATFARPYWTPAGLQALQVMIASGTMIGAWQIEDQHDRPLEGGDPTITITLKRTGKMVFFPSGGVSLLKSSHFADVTYVMGARALPSAQVADTSEALRYLQDNAAEFMGVWN